LLIKLILFAVIVTIIGAVLQIPSPYLDKPVRQQNSTQNNTQTQSGARAKKASIAAPAQIGAPKTNDNQKQSKQSLYRVLLDWIMAEASFTDWMVAVSTFVYAIAATFTLWAIKGQLKHMTNETRPWIGPDGDIPITNTMIEWRNGQLWATVNVLIGNHGKLPGALKEMEITFILAQFGDDNIIGKTLRGAHSGKVPKKGSAQTIFPSGKRVFSEIKQAHALSGQTGDDVALVLYVIGRLAYRSSGLGYRTYRTSFCYQYRDKELQIPIMFRRSDSGYRLGIWAEFATLAD